ncbi:alpha/beta fold hydrolase [Paraconexibacter algicola]|uniref:alpha/beta fold hydrolase n=1 Tax=Paraconexibacter algicola TaxID=2133960 RepID=UPI001E29542B|nr:alpha/beta hydrolase [Paraconexibacter algicola]
MRADRPPLLLLHGFADAPCTWDLLAPRLAAHHTLLAPALAGHLGGPPLPDPPSADALVDAVEAQLDAAGHGTVDVVGSSLGGYLALRLAQRGRARSVVALAPAGGWGAGEGPGPAATLDRQARLLALARAGAAHADVIAATPEGRRRATALVCERGEDLPARLVAALVRAPAGCTGGPALIAAAREHGWPLQAAAVRCPVRVVWGREDRLLPWPSAARRWQRELVGADWVELDGVGHCPQLDVPVETAALVLEWTQPDLTSVSTPG